MAKVNKVEKLQEDQVKYHLALMIKESYWYPEPNRTFEVGEEVIYGNHKKSTINESFEGGKFYLIAITSINENYGRPYDYEQQQYVFWVNLFKKQSWPVVGERFSVEDRIFINYSNTTLGSLIFRSYNSLNFNPDYQRDLVWSMEDKISLLDSIFNNVEIGKFSLIALDYHKTGFDFDHDYFYEILDGKQRLSTLRDFYEDRFEYRGRLYSQLNISDKYHFDGYNVAMGEVKEPRDRNDIYRYFLKLNTTGKPMPKEQIEKVKGMITNKD